MAQLSNIMIFLLLLTFLFASSLMVPAIESGLGYESSKNVSVINSLDESISEYSSNERSIFDNIPIFGDMFKLIFIGQVVGLPPVFDYMYTIVGLVVIVLGWVSLVPTTGGGA